MGVRGIDYETTLPVRFPCARRGELDLIILPIMGAYSAEIKEDILDNINPDVLFAELEI